MENNRKKEANTKRLSQWHRTKQLQTDNMPPDNVEASRRKQCQQDL